MISTNDKTQLLEKGIKIEQVMEQLERFKNGFPYLKLSDTASVGHGILKLNEQEIQRMKGKWRSYISSGHTILKFVPASGAASRMFKDLFAFIDADYDEPTTPFEKEFFDNLSKFVFYDTLNKRSNLKYKKSLDELKQEKSYKDIVKLLLDKDGLSYGTLPKGVLEFHIYPTTTRTAIEEHLVEGALYAQEADKKVRIHFTVSKEFIPIFKELIEEKKNIYEPLFKVSYDITFSIQKPSTDTIAVDLENSPFRSNDKLLFRPGGHGALIENMNDLVADIVFIKNIDNIVPDHLKAVTVEYKQVLAGILVDLQEQCFTYLNLLNSGKYTHDQVLEILQFVQKKLYCKNPNTNVLEDSELVLYLINKLNRPIRVCGMVKNIGEPGGGPFLAYNSDGTISLQILESSQIDKQNEDYLTMFKNGTHFNPVDLVCGLYDYKGIKFDLSKYVDPDTGFISEKSKDGKILKALELPGLWNGAMSDWNTIFVEVPLLTFNPVKTVNDLLRPEHQPQ